MSEERQYEITIGERTGKNVWTRARDVREITVEYKENTETYFESERLSCYFVYISEWKKKKMSKEIVYTLFEWSQLVRHYSKYALLKSELNIV